MPQVFPKAANLFAQTMIIVTPLLLGGGAVTGMAFYRSDYTTGSREVVDQPVPFSHLHHVSQLGIDCKYCHTAVEKSGQAGFPPTKTCMNCHQQMWVGSAMLAPVRDSYKQEIPIAWNKVHNVPHYTYFNHSIHVSKGVGCYSCHGQVDNMPLVYQSKSLLMEWCLECHRAPERYLRPREEVYNLRFQASDYIDPKTGKQENPDTGKPYSQLELGRKLKEEYKVREASILTNCSICHR
jgi:hypothetical protein